MKLKTKLIPLTVMSGIAAVAVPAVTSCSCGGNKTYFITNGGEYSDSISMVASFRQIKAGTRYTLIADTNDWAPAEELYTTNSWTIELKSESFSFIKNEGSEGSIKFNVIELKLNDKVLKEDVDYKWDIRGSGQDVENFITVGPTDEDPDFGTETAEVKRGDIISLTMEPINDMSPAWFAMSFEFGGSSIK